jgi:hypothetical protein
MIAVSSFAPAGRVTIHTALHRLLSVPCQCAVTPDGLLVVSQVGPCNAAARADDVWAQEMNVHPVDIHGTVEWEPIRQYWGFDSHE